MNRYTTKKAHSDALIGRRVQVISPGRYGNKCLGCFGTVRVVWNPESVGVDLDLEVNEGSKYGYFYFKTAELAIVDNKDKKAETAEEEKGENKMEKMTNYVNVAEVQFLNDTGFRTIECANYDPLLAVGDLCVVMTKRHGMGLAQVEAIKERTDADLFREVVTGLDTSAYDDRVAKRQKAAELKVRMQERAQQLQDVVLYQTLAKEDPEMAAMLQEFMALGK